MLNFKYEDGFKNKNKYFPAISIVQYLSNKTIRRPPQSHETIPLNSFLCKTQCGSSVADPD
jgi:hypothetical protein